MTTITNISYLGGMIETELIQRYGKPDSKRTRLFWKWIFGDKK